MRFLDAALDAVAVSRGLARVLTRSRASAAPEQRFKVDQIQISHAQPAAVPTPLASPATASGPLCTNEKPAVAQMANRPASLVCKPTTLATKQHKAEPHSTSSVEDCTDTANMSVAVASAPLRGDANRTPSDASAANSLDRSLAFNSPQPRLTRSSPVPSSRLARLVQFAGLSASLGFGAASDAMKRSWRGPDGPGQESVGFLSSEANVKRLVDRLSRMRGAALKFGQFMSIQGNSSLLLQLTMTNLG